ncbi:MAG: SDR family NAD(P)-dependent oxidoreductase [Opitutales bacterium]
MSTPITPARLALVTGANRGIGFAIARALAEDHGHTVLLGCRDLRAAEEAGVGIKGATIPFELDLADNARLGEQIRALVDRHPDLEVLVNNAGVLPRGTLLELSEEDIAASLAVHLTGPLSLVRALAPQMQRRGFGRIVNVSSGYGSFAEGLEGPGAYGWTKASLNALTLRLARDLPGSIKVNAMCPGWVRTRMGGDDAARSPEEGADTAVWLATLPDDGPTGGFFRDRQPIAW